jgi:hypothetical protein
LKSDSLLWKREALGLHRMWIHNLISQFITRLGHL